MSKSGFTLIEMLIVIAVIAILASVILVGLGPVQKQGRDSRRISDLRQVQNGLELYYNKCGFYPGANNFGNSACATAGSDDPVWNNLANALISSNIGVSNVPVDPTNNTIYFYRYGTDANQDNYVLGAQLEDSGNPSLKNNTNGSVNGIDCTAPVYCIQL